MLPESNGYQVINVPISEFLSASVGPILVNASNGRSFVTAALTSARHQEAYVDAKRLKAKFKKTVKIVKNVTKILENVCKR